MFIGRTDVEAETPILWPPDAKSWLIWKDPDAGKDWRREEKGTTEDEMVGWHHQLNRHGFGLTPGVGDGQGGLVCCGSWGCKESDMTERLNWTELIKCKLILYRSILAYEWQQVLGALWRCIKSLGHVGKSLYLICGCGLMGFYNYWNQLNWAILKGTVYCILFTIKDNNKKWTRTISNLQVGTVSDFFIGCLYFCSSLQCLLFMRYSLIFLE